MPRKRKYRSRKPSRKRYKSFVRKKRKSVVKFHRTPFPTRLRVLLPFIDYTNVGASAGIGVPQELIYTCNGIYDCDTQAMTQSAAYFKRLMEVYNNFIVRRAKIWVKWTQQDDAVDTTNFIFIRNSPISAASSLNYLDLMTNTTITRSKIVTANTRYSGESRNKLSFKMSNQSVRSSFYDGAGNKTANPLNTQYFHVIQYPTNILVETLPVCVLWVKIEYYVEFCGPDPLDDPYAVS